MRTSANPDSPRSSRPRLLPVALLTVTCFAGWGRAPGRRAGTRPRRGRDGGGRAAEQGRAGASGESAWQPSREEPAGEVRSLSGRQGKPSAPSSGKPSRRRVARSEGGGRPVVTPRGRGRPAGGHSPGEGSLPERGSQLAGLWRHEGPRGDAAPPGCPRGRPKAGMSAGRTSGCEAWPAKGSGEVTLGLKPE